MTVVDAAATNRARAAALIAGIALPELIAEWVSRLTDAGVLRDVRPSDATVAKIVAGLQRGLVLHLRAQRPRLDQATRALADEAAMAHIFQTGVTITQITEGIFQFLDVVFGRLVTAQLYVPEVGEVVRDFAKTFLREADQSWSSILLSQRNDAERAQAELQRMLEATNEGILLVGADLKLRYANERAGQLLGAPLSPHVGANVHEVFAGFVAAHLTDSTSFLARSWRIYNDVGAMVSDVVDVADPPRLLSRYSSPVTDATGATIGRLEIYRDITEERQSREQRDQFLSLVGHELRTPLAAISGYTDLASRTIGRLLTSDERDEAQLKRVDTHLFRAHANVQRMARLVETLLDIKRLESGEMPLDLRPLDLAQVVRESIANYAGVNERPVKLELPVEPVPIIGDPDRLEQVVANLLNNAYRHASPTFSVEVALTTDGGEAALTVTDDGTGVPAAERERIFERFYRLPEKGYRSGMGVGLFIVKRLVAGHGGRIDVSDRVEGGACFTVRVPLAREEGA